MRAVKNQKGLSLIEFIASVGISSLVLLVGAAVVISTKDLSKQGDLYAELSNRKNEIESILKNDVSFGNTLSGTANASSFSCLINSINCYGAGGNFSLYDIKGNIQSLTSAPTDSSGMTASGQACSSFNGTQGNDACPFKFVASWTPRCVGGGTCLNPTMDVKVILLFSPKTPVKFPTLNLAKFAMTISKVSVTATAEISCTKMGGVVQLDGSCKLPFVNTSCPPNQYIVGFSSNGSMLCRTLNGYSCPFGQVLLGVDATGIARCGPGCSDLGSSAGTIW